MTDVKTGDLSVRLCKSHQSLHQIHPDVETNRNMRMMDVVLIYYKVACAGGSVRIFTLGANVFNHRQDFFIVFIRVKANL